ncbi:hypothetical protein GLAREA_10089 [Glarea lozoyensis ATCC 20868]|uniref:Uncharacterized protein n=1 Tax=Glarea lozoyensis (strain ATCC 20868 / MF5171) TaxID=1116229 RepID=S3D9I8_GLAL2|nr:uncharacterized protein GLAREA_10089 [Glarea lozoyensis ATCC 20868]EPE34395.1 hypothetical protein GLAREA_10089 [Glarea lozoyensis ATCC 20868]
MPTSKRKASKSGGARRKKQNTGRQIKVEKHEEVSGDERSMRGVKKEENRKVHNVKIEKREEVPSERSGMEGVQKEEQKEEKWQQYKVEKHEVEFDEGNGEGRAHEKDDETSHTIKKEECDESAGENTKDFLHSINVDDDESSSERSYSGSDFELDAEVTPVGFEEKDVVEPAAKIPRSESLGHPSTVREQSPNHYRGSRWSALNKFRWKDNTHIKLGTVPYHVGNPKPLIITLYNTKGEAITFEPRCTDVIDWNSEPSVKKRNCWFYKVVYRRLGRHRLAGTCSGHLWTILEKDSLIERVRDEILKVGRKLKGNDWKNILDSHNKFFKNHKVNIGDEYTNDHKSSRTRVMETRTMRAIRGKLLKWKDARKIVEDTYKEVGVRRRYWRKIDREELKAEKEKIKKNDGRNVDVREDVDDREETEDEEELDDGSETDETPERTVSEESLIGDADSEHTRYEITYGKEEVLAMLATLNARS